MISAPLPASAPHPRTIGRGPPLRRESGSREPGPMILVTAAGSTGFYMSDEDGRIYTQHTFMVDPAGTLGPAPGDRPDLRRHPQYARCRPYWLPTGATEDLDDEGLALLETARLRRAMVETIAASRARVLERLDDVAARVGDVRESVAG